MSQAAPWQGWRPAVCMPDDCFCERPRGGWVRQPANAWSNLAALLLGLALVAAAARRRPAGWGGFGALVALLGAGSFFYHASLTYAGQWVDVLGMYLVVGYLALVSLRRASLLPGGAGAFGAWLAALALVSGGFLAYGLAYGRPIFAALVLALVGAELRARRAVPPRARPPLAWFFAALGLLAAGFSIWCVDRFRLVCSPDSLWQGHAAWHVLTAASIWAGWRYYANGPAWEASRAPRG